MKKLLVLVLLLSACEAKKPRYNPHNAESLIFWEEDSFMSDEHWMLEDEYYDLLDSCNQYLTVLSVVHDGKIYNECRQKSDSFHIAMDEAYTILTKTRKIGKP